MSVPLWPADLPKPLRQGYRATREDTRRRRAAAGPLGYSRRYSTRAHLVTLAIEVPLHLKTEFWDFFDITLKDGTLPFRMPDPTGDGQPLFGPSDEPILDAGGDPILLAAEWLCLFGEDMPQERLQAALYQITFSVVVLP